MESEITRLKIKNQMLESDNRILLKQLKERESDLKILNELYQKEKKTTALALDKVYYLEEELKKLKRC